MPLRARRRYDDRGITLIETIVTIVILSVATMAMFNVYLRSHAAQLGTERQDAATAQVEKVRVASQAIAYSDLGYYDNDAGFTAGNITLPLWVTANGAVIDNPTSCTPVGGVTCPTKLVEPQIDLGASRPTGTTAFTPRTQVLTIRGITYRFDTWVTKTPDGSKRVTVQAESPAAGGTCTATGVKCVVQSFVRGASSADQAPNGTQAVSSCTTGTAAICKDFIASGRVLSGEKMRSSVDSAVPMQITAVPLYVRTTLPATAVSATWQWKAADGSVLSTVTVSPFTMVDGDAHQWQASVPADTDVGSIKGWLRPGSTTVTFTATINGAAVTATTPAHWSYTNSTDVAITGAAAVKCDGSTGQARVNVTGLSMGFGTQSDSGQDKVTFEFPVVQSGKAQSVTVVGTVDPASVSPQYTYQSGAMVGGWVNASFTAPVPASDLCVSGTDTPSPFVTVLVKRASDNTTTAKTLSLVIPF